MAADKPTGTSNQPPCDYSKAQTTYANFLWVNATAEELVIDFGLTGNPGAKDGHPVSQRVVMNYFTAKRLLMVLGVAVGQHEKDFGELEIDPQKRLKK